MSAVDPGKTTAGTGDDQAPQGGGATDDDVTYTADDAKKFKEQKDRISGEVREWQNKYAEIEKRYKGVNLDEYKAQKAEKERLERELAEKDPKKLEDMLTRKFGEKEQTYNSEIQELKDALTKRDSVIKTLTVTDKVMSTVGKLFNDDVHEFIKRKVEERADLEEGQIVFKDENGSIIYSKKNRSNYMGADEYGQYLADLYPSLAKPTGGGGGKDQTNGVKTQKGNHRVPNTWAELTQMPNPQAVLDAMTPEQLTALAGNTRVGGQAVR